MGKEKNARRVSENEAMAKLRMIKSSPQKLNLVAQLIRNKPVSKALSDLKFSKKRVANHVSSCLQSAIANAENNMVLKRGRPRARGRYGKILKPFSQITIVVRQNREED